MPPTMSVSYATVGGRLVREVRNSVITRYVSDPLGSVVQTRNSAGTLTSSTEFWPFGEVRTSSGSNPSPWGFVGTLGYFADLASRLYVRARYYRTNLSRWMTVDPLWPREPVYKYGRSSPIEVVDPSGWGQGVWPDKWMSGEERALLEKLLAQIKSMDLSQFDICLDQAPCFEESDANRDNSRHLSDLVRQQMRRTVIVQFSYNCAPNECGWTQKGGWPDEAWYVHICMRGGKLQLDPKCGNMVCTLIHELLHALGLKHPEHNEALRCVNKIPGCENTPQKGPGWKEGKQ